MATLAFLRSESTQTLLYKDLSARGFRGLVEIMRSAKLPHFAEWRWCTLEDACVALYGFWESFILNVDVRIFPQRSRDRTQFNRFCECLGAEFQVQFKLVRWICGWLGGILRWGGGCACHEDELAAGEAVVCWKKGRRLIEAFPFITERLQFALQTISEWTARDFAGYPYILQQALGCVRGTYALAKRKTDFFNRVPYALARLDQPNVKALCLAQWAEVPPESHDPITREFLDPRLDLREAVDSLGDDGEGASIALQLQITSLQDVPFDDTLAEGPHAVARRVAQRSRRSSFGYVLRVAIGRFLYFGEFGGPK